MTLPEAIAYANETGWVVYALNQATCAQDPPWRCTLREDADKPRCNISNGKGDTPEEAIVDALAAAPELEPEAKVSDLLQVAREANTNPSLLALIGYRPNLQPTRTRS